MILRLPTALLLGLMVFGIGQWRICRITWLALYLTTRYGLAEAERRVRW